MAHENDTPATPRAGDVPHEATSGPSPYAEPPEQASTLDELEAHPS